MVVSVVDVIRTRLCYLLFSDKGWPDGNRHTPSDQNKVPWSDPLQDQLLDSFCDDMFGMNIGGGKMGPPPNNGTHQVNFLIVVVSIQISVGSR